MNTEGFMEFASKQYKSEMCFQHSSTKYDARSTLFAGTCIWLRTLPSISN